MKTAIRIFTIITVMTLTLSGISFSRDFPDLTTTTPSGKPATTSIMDYPIQDNPTTTSRIAVSDIPVRPEKREGESDSSYASRLRNWETEIKNIVGSSTNIPPYPGRFEGESDAAYNKKLDAWKLQISQIATEREQTQSSVSNISSSNVPLPRPAQREGESAEQYNARIRAWEAQVRSIIAASAQSQISVPSSRSFDELPPRPVQREGESSDVYNDRIRAWEMEIMKGPRGQRSQSLISTKRTPSIPDRPEQREGESAAQYNSRLRAWETEVRRISAETEMNRLKQEMDKLNNLISRTSSFSNPVDSSSENPLIVPTGQMKVEELLTINEDMKIMAQIFINNLKQNGIPFSPSPGAYGSAINLESPVNNTSSMYLQGYGALFIMNVNFPLSAPSESQQAEEEQTNGEGPDSLWEQARRQIQETQSISPGPRRITASSPPQTNYDAQRVENLKSSLIQSLKHATNIRGLQADECVTIRITGIAASDSVVVYKEPGKDRFAVFQNFQNNTIATQFEGQLPDDLNYSPTFLIISAKKADIDAFANNELDYNSFLEKVQILSYPVLGGIMGTAK